MSDPKDTRHAPTPFNGPLVVQELGSRPGYPAWTQFAIRDQKTNVHIATVGHVDRYFEGKAESHAEFIVRAVNAHEQLVDALETFQRSEVSTHVESYVKWCRESGPASHVETTERERICRAAYLAGWSAMWSSVSMQVESALRAARGEK